MLVQGQDVFLAIIRQIEKMGPAKRVRPLGVGLAVPLVREEDGGNLSGGVILPLVIIGAGKQDDGVDLSRFCTIVNLCKGAEQTLSSNGGKGD